MVRITLCHTRFSLEFLLCADGEYVPTGRPSDGSEWCVESLPPPEAAEASGGRVSPRPWLCDQSPVLPLCSGSTHPLSSSRLASVTIGHQATEDTGPAPGDISKVTTQSTRHQLYTAHLRHASLARITRGCLISQVWPRVCLCVSFCLHSWCSFYGSERDEWYLRRSFSEYNWQCVSVCLAACYVRSYSFESNIH